MSMIEFTSEANFEIALEQGQFPPFLGNESCEILIDDQKVMTGFIDIVDVQYSTTDHKVNYTVRDRTADFADSSIDVINDLSGSLSLVKVIQIVLSHLGLSNIEVLNKVDGLKNFDITKDDLAPEVGENCFEYCEKLARKRQVILTTNADGNIELIRNSGETYKIPFQNSFNDVNKQNNIKSGSFAYNYGSSFRKYIVKSQLGKASSSGVLSFGTTSNKDVANQEGFFEDKGVRKGRQTVIIASESSAEKDNNEQAKWQANFNRSASSTYNIVFYGHSLGDELLITNKLFSVLDDFAEIDEVQLIESIEFQYDLQGGSISSISLADKDSFTLTVTEPLEGEKKKSGNGLLSFNT
jgi:prophage tail gpP-like protein